MGFRCGEKVPYICIRIGNSIADGLTGINNAATANSQKKINLFFAAKLNTLTYLGETGIGNHTAKSDIGNSSFIQRRSDLIDQTGAYCTVAAIMDQYFAAVLLFRTVPILRCVSFPKNNPGRGKIFKISHRD